MRQTIYKMDSMKGLGDNIYQRAFIKKIASEHPFVLDTPWPEIYQDLPNVYFEPCRTELRTQKKNAKKTDYCGRRASDFPGYRRTHSRQLPAKVVNLGQMRYRNTGIINGMKELFKVEPERMDLPTFEPSNRIKPIIGTKYALIRPVTVRTEWSSASRNPKTEYLKAAISFLKMAGYSTVSIADVDGINEKFVGEKPDCDIEFNSGQLNIREILSLTQNAAIVVGGIGWLVPAAIAYGVNACFICGGWGMYNHPKKLLPEHETPSIHFMMPDNFCECTSSTHDCDKTIKNFDQRFKELLCSLQPIKKAC